MLGVSTCRLVAPPHVPLAEPMARLIEELRKLPGIGAKSAQRCLHILRSSAADADALSDAWRELKAKLRLCSICNNIHGCRSLRLLSSPRATSVRSAWSRTDQHWRDRTTHYNGVYHVLHGTLSPCTASTGALRTGRSPHAPSAARSTRPSSPPAPRWKAKRRSLLADLLKPYAIRITRIAPACQPAATSSIRMKHDDPRARRPARG